MSASRWRRIAGVFFLAATLSLGATACSGEGDDLSAQWNEGSEKGYVAGDGATTSIAEGSRGEAVEFSGEAEDGSTITSAELAGSVAVINFWYAGCAPCRAEAPELAAVDAEYRNQGVIFLGVNTRDQVAQAEQFAKQFGIEYPSIMDVAGGRAVQQAFAGEIPLNAVPTTLILDTQGRVAHRVVGQLAGASQLRTLLDETLAESGS